MTKEEIKQFVRGKLPGYSMSFGSTIEGETVTLIGFEENGNPMGSGFRYSKDQSRENIEDMLNEAMLQVKQAHLLPNPKHA